MTEYTITVDYIGGILSENSYKFLTRGTKPIVKAWMKDLASRVKALGIPSSESYDIRVLGRFASDSRPDISNLFKVISDAIANGLGVDDKHFKLIDEGAQIGYLDPTLVITIVGGAS